MLFHLPFSLYTVTTPSISTIFPINSYSHHRHPTSRPYILPLTPRLGTTSDLLHRHPGLGGQPPRTLRGHQRHTGRMQCHSEPSPVLLTRPKISKEALTCITTHSAQPPIFRTTRPSPPTLHPHQKAVNPPNSSHPHPL